MCILAGMKRDHSFHDYLVHDVLGFLPHIVSRSMFGGWAIYQEGHIFALISQGELYFKADDHNRQTFIDLGGKPFAYDGRDATKMTMSYWSLPEEIFMKKEELAKLVQGSVAASIAKATKSVKKRKG